MALQGGQGRGKDIRPTQGHQGLPGSSECHKVK